jgi:FixJ family two-component response regulator
MGWQRDCTQSPKHRSEPGLTDVFLDRDIQRVFTDVDMPGSMDGVKLAHYVQTRWPPVKIIVTSGFTHVTPDQLPAGSMFLRKPYGAEQLQHHIARLVNS